MLSIADEFFPWFTRSMRINDLAYIIIMESYAFPIESFPLLSGVYSIEFENL